MLVGSRIWRKTKLVIEPRKKNGWFAEIFLKYRQQKSYFTLLKKEIEKIGESFRFSEQDIKNKKTKKKKTCKSMHYSTS